MSDPLYPPDDFGEAFDAAATRLREAVAAACARPEPWPARVCAAVEAVLEFAAADPAAAHLLLVEPWAHGEAGAARRERLHDRFAALLASGREELPGGAELPGLTEQVLVAGDEGPVLVVFAGAQGIALDPDELEAFVGRWPDLPASAWVELHVAKRLRVVIEPLANPEPK